MINDNDIQKLLQEEMSLIKENMRQIRNEMKIIQTNTSQIKKELAPILHKVTKEH